MIKLCLGLGAKIAFVFVVQTSLLAETGMLKRVIDGDTLYFYSNGRTVKCRMAWIDTPESHRNERAKRKAGQCTGVTLSRMVEAGKAAAQHAKTLVDKGKAYRFEVTGHDRYGRAICVVQLPGDETFNERMVADGYAAPFWKYVPSDMDRKFKTLVTEAKRRRAGLWSSHKPVMECLSR